MKSFLTFCIPVFLISLNSCWILPQDVTRAIYFDVPERTDDLVPQRNAKSERVLPHEEVLHLEEESPLEYNSRNFFTKGDYVARAKPNVLDVYRNNHVIVGYHDGSVFLVQKADSGEFNKKLIAKGTSQILSLKVSPDQRYLAVSQFSVVTIIDLNDFRLVAQMHRVKGRILELAWSPDSSSLLLGRANGDVFSWRLEENIHYSLDSLDVLEMYETEASPVVDILFHPSGRAFFVALENGGMFLVRLVQTEVDLGLREEGKEYEIDKGSYVQKFTIIPTGISKMMMLAEREELLVVSISGSATRWRMRGLRQIEEVDIGSEASTFAALYDKETNGSGADIVASIGRSLRLKLSCLSKNYVRLAKPTTDVIQVDSDEPQEIAQSPSNSLDDEALIRELNSEIKKKQRSRTEELNLKGKDLNLIIETPKYLESISVMELDKNTGELWVGGKSGIISVFNLKKYLESPVSQSRIQSICN